MTERRFNYYSMIKQLWNMVLDWVYHDIISQMSMPIGISTLSFNTFAVFRGELFGTLAPILEVSLYITPL